MGKITAVKSDVLYKSKLTGVVYGVEGVVSKARPSGKCGMDITISDDVLLRNNMDVVHVPIENLDKNFEVVDVVEKVITSGLVEQPTPKEKLSLPTYYCEEKLQDTALDVWTSRSGDLCVNLTSLGVNNEIVMNPIVALQFANDLSVLALKIMEKENE